MRIALLLLTIATLAFARPAEEVAKNAEPAKAAEIPAKVEQPAKEVEAATATKKVESPPLVPAQETAKANEKITEAIDTTNQDKSEGLAVEVDEKAIETKAPAKIESAPKSDVVPEQQAKDLGTNTAETEKKADANVQKEETPMKEEPASAKQTEAAPAVEKKPESEAAVPAQEKSIDIVEAANTQAGVAAESGDVLVPKPEKKIDLPVAPEVPAATNAKAETAVETKADDQLKVLPKEVVEKKSSLDSSEEKDDVKKDSSEEKKDKPSSN